MVSETKAISDTCLHKHESISSLIPLKLISSINSNNIRKYRSGNNISSRKKLQKSIKSINDNYQRFSNKNLINTHFPIANIQQDSTMMSKTSSSSQFPRVPKQTDTFIHRLVNKFFSKNDLSRIKQKAMNTILSNDSHTVLNITPKKRKRQRIKPTKNNHCNACRRYRNCSSNLPTDSLEYTSQSPIIFNTNATTTTLKNPSIFPIEPSISLPKIQFEKRRPLNESQCHTIASAFELIFDTLISNYQQK